MVRSRTTDARRGIGALYSMGTIGNLGDGQLLERFATDRGEGAELAFAVLVERHGPMVLRVCHSVLSDWHDTEDAFQATFLVLVRKARRLWVAIRWARGCIKSRCERRRRRGSRPRGGGAATDVPRSRRLRSRAKQATS